MSVAHPLLSITRAVRLALTVTDPEVVTELERHEEGAERDEFALRAVRVGVLAMAQANGVVDTEAIRRAGDDVVHALRDAFVANASQMNAELGQSLGQYLDPNSGSFPQRLEQLTKGGGELERMLMKHLDGERSTIHKTLEQVVGPTSPLLKMLSPQQADGVVATMRRTIDELLTKQKAEMLKQFSLDEKGSALARLVAEVSTANGQLRVDLSKDVDRVAKEFSLDNPHGALSRLVGQVERAQKTIVEQLSLDHDGSALRRMSTMLEKTNLAIEGRLTLDEPSSPLARLRRELQQMTDRIEQSQTKFQTEIREAVAALQARREEASRSTRHGVTFEDAMGDFLRADAQNTGDVYDRVGKRLGSTGARKGDHLVTLGPESAAPGTRVVVESKADKSYTEAGAIAELELARANREAQIGVFVFDAQRAPDGIDGFRRIGNDVFAIWSVEDASTDIYLRAAMSIARAIAVRERASTERSEASLRDIERSIREIEKQVKSIETIAKAARTVQARGTTILGVTDAMKAVLEKQIAALRENLDALRDDAAAE